MLISEVNPAMASEAKKSTPNSSPMGMLEMISGNATNARPIPRVANSSTGTPAVAAMTPIVANTPIPASSSNELLARPATMAEPLRSERRRRYDEYVIMMPKPTDREKKICPYACTHPVLSVMADQSGEKKALRPRSEEH